MINQLFKPILEALPENNRAERIWVLAKTDFLKRYYGSFLGLIWALINPLTQLAIYYLVFKVVFKNEQEHFALFLFLGLIFYMFFVEASSKGLNLLRSKRYILENIQINWMDIYYAASLSTLFAFLFNLFSYFTISLFCDISINTQAIGIPILVFNLLIFGMAVQIILSVIQIYVRDIEHLWDLVKMVLLWLSGIFYPIDSTLTWKSAILAYLTPLPGIIHNTRNVLIYGEPMNSFLFLYDMMYALILFVVAWFVFAKLSSAAMEKI